MGVTPRCHVFVDGCCICCGVSMLVPRDAYEKCPKRTEHKAPTAIELAAAGDIRVEVNVSPSQSVRPTASGVICYRCRATVLPRIVRVGGTTGYVGTQMENVAVFAPVTRERFASECPKCGAPFACTDELRRLNGDPSDRQWRVIMWLWVLALTGLLALLIACIPYF